MAAEAKEGRVTVEEFWEERYAASQVWSGRVNRVLMDVAGELPPGRALDLGCGEGGDALWLARHGWQVTAVDISSTAIERGRQAAAAAGLTDRIRWIAHDLADWTPDDEFDLVSAFFLQSPVHLPRASILRLATGAIAPGGRLLVVSHAAAPPWASGLRGHHHVFPSPAQEVDDLGLALTEWDVVVAEVRSREATGPDGSAAVLDDTVVLARRRPA
jgi:SAM-dependent methyltransferase